MGNQQASKFGRPLSELGQVDWASLTHAYGSAENVPAQLEAIAAGDEQAYQDAFGNLWHQWTTYSATPHAIPFLIDILEAGTRNVEMLDLLGVMGRGNGEEQEAVLDALRVGLPLYLTALKGAAEDARAAAYLLSAFLNRHDIDKRFVARLLDYTARTHPDKSVQAACIYHLRHCEVEVTDELLIHVLMHEAERVFKLPCALFLANILGTNATPRAETVLEEVLLQGQEVFQEGLTIDPDDIFEEVAKAEAIGDDHWLTYLKDLEG